MSMLPLKFRWAWIGAMWLLALVIIAGSLAPAFGPAPIPGFDKVEHFSAYFALTLLGSAVVTPEGMPWVAARAILLGLAMEGAQALFTKTRSADWADVLANTTGVMTAWWLVRRRAGWGLLAEAWLDSLRRH